MKMKVVKKAFVMILAAALIVMPSMRLTVKADGGDGIEESSAEESSTEESSIEESSVEESSVEESSIEESSSEESKSDTISSISEKEVLNAVNQSISSASEDGGGYEAVNSIMEIPDSSTVAGVSSSVSGVYVATSVSGTAVTTSLANIADSYDLSPGEKPYARIYNMDVKKSSQAADVINQTAEAIGAIVGPYVNVELGKMGGGKFELLSSDGAEVTLKFGIPKSFTQSGKTFAMVCVRPGGAVTILEDMDDNPDTVTFNTTGGQGAYAIIKY
ncbi:MAG: hypothetical protein NC231_06075 [Bacillus sp. (in: Bacteria)]|nr:hypothetical protein [Bacillus sp. (in: firmicutes)]MCM1427602.1 hypothetical protein [Eubacterium sp.]